MFPVYKLFSENCPEHEIEEKKRGVVFGKLAELHIISSDLSEKISTEELAEIFSKKTFQTLLLGLSQLDDEEIKKISSLKDLITHFSVDSVSLDNIKQDAEQENNSSMSQLYIEFIKKKIERAILSPAFNESLDNTIEECSSQKKLQNGPSLKLNDLDIEIQTVFWKEKGGYHYRLFMTDADSKTVGIRSTDIKERNGELIAEGGSIKISHQHQNQGLSKYLECFNEYVLQKISNIEKKSITWSILNGNAISQNSLEQQSRGIEDITAPLLKDMEEQQKRWKHLYYDRVGVDEKSDEMVIKPDDESSRELNSISNVTISFPQKEGYFVDSEEFITDEERGKEEQKKKQKYREMVVVRRIER